MFLGGGRLRVPTRRCDLMVPADWGWGCCNKQTRCGIWTAIFLVWDLTGHKLKTCICCLFFLIGITLINLEGEWVVVWVESIFFSRWTRLSLWKCITKCNTIFFNRIPQMTKYCIMRECENIHSWISLIGDLVFSHQQGIYGFKFPKKFLEVSSRDLTLLSFLII